MKIALLAHNLFPIAEPYAGGMEMITHLLAHKLQSQGHEVHLYAAAGSDKHLNIIPYQAEKCQRVPGIKEPPNYPERQESFQFAAAFTDMAQANYDIIHNHTQHYLPILLGERLKTPMLTTFHTPAFEFIQYAFHYLNKPTHQQFTCVSKSLSGVYNAFGILSETIYNGIDLNAWTYRNEAVEDALLWFGRICPEKGTHQAIALARRMNMKLYLAGPISNGSYYEEFVKQHIDGQQIIYKGHLEHKALNDLIGSCKASLFLSTWEEPYGLAIAESLACGTPVIAWNKGASPEILTGQSGVIVEEDNMPALENAVYKAFSLKRIDCRSRAEQFCDIDQMVNAYTDMYYEMLEKNQNIAVL